MIKNKFTKKREFLSLFVAAASVMTLGFTSTLAVCAAEFHTLHEFKGGPNDGAVPSGLTSYGSRLYGTTQHGGTERGGTVFSVSLPPDAGGAVTEQDIADLPDALLDVETNAPVISGPGGLLYGTTSTGGTDLSGTVYSLTPPAEPGGKWIPKVLHNFTGGPGDGAHPISGVVEGKGGVLYGTTPDGGAMAFGTIFSLTPPQPNDGEWVYATIASLPLEDLTIYGLAVGPGGVLYGAGAGASTGSVFSLSPPATPGNAWRLDTIYSFPALGGDEFAGATLTIGSRGVIYGVTTYGGTTDLGTVFSLTPPVVPGGAWTETTLWNMQGGSDGAKPTSQLAFGEGGVLYGTTYAGGTAGLGTVFSLSPPATSGDTWTHTVLYSFMGSTVDGGNPIGVVLGEKGHLFGTTYADSNSLGTIFQITP